MTTRQIRTIPLFATLLLMASGLNALAASGAETPGLADAYKSQMRIRHQLEAGDVSQPAQHALNVLVARGIMMLAESGEGVLAEQLDREWHSGFVNYLPTHLVTNPSMEGSHGFINDIGDHDALSPWLATFHDTLAAKTSGVIDGFRVVSDIFKMNYALGVVLHPKSKSWKSGESQADEWEYRKHFIPMANIITYWVTLESCNYFAAQKFPPAKRLCPTAATKLEFYMGRYWAPQISDFVYRKANMIKTSRGTRFADADLTESFVLTEDAFEQEVLSAQL